MQDGAFPVLKYDPLWICIFPLSKYARQDPKRQTENPEKSTTVYVNYKVKKRDGFRRRTGVSSNEFY